MYSYASAKKPEFSVREYFLGVKKHECACERAMRMKREAEAKNNALAVDINNNNNTAAA